MIKKVSFKLRSIFRSIYYSVINFYLKIFFKQIHVSSIDKTLDDIIEFNYSISRYGDGEIRLINKEAIEFQEYSPQLQARLSEVITSDSNGHKVCLPYIFSTLSIYRTEAQYFWKWHLRKFYFIWIKNINKKKVYFNSFVTRPYITFKDRRQCKKWFDKIKELWIDKDIIIIEGVHSRLGVGNDLFNRAKSTKRILCPSLNAFAKYTEILEAAKLQTRDKLLLIALGPTATVLAYDLFLEGFQALDIGHIDIEYEWFLMKADWKVNIQTKHTNEASNALPIDVILDEKYNSEIISIIQ